MCKVPATLASFVGRDGQRCSNIRHGVVHGRTTHMYARGVSMLMSTVHLSATLLPTSPKAMIKSITSPVTRSSVFIRQPIDADVASCRHRRVPG